MPGRHGGAVGTGVRLGAAAGQVEGAAATAVDLAGSAMSRRADRPVGAAGDAVPDGSATMAAQPVADG